MKIHGLPETFWVITRPTEVSGLADICFSCTFGQLMLQTRGGLEADDIIGIFADEAEAMELAKNLLGEHVVHPQDALALEILVHMMVFPKDKDMTFNALSGAAVEAVENAVRHAEEVGFQRDDDLGPFKMIPRESDFAEQGVFGLTGVVVGSGLPLHVAQSRQRLC